MATESQNIFINKKPNFHCATCKKVIKEGDKFVDIQDQQKGMCFKCSSFKDYVFLPPGDAAYQTV
ncbi:MAG: hypothetical protein IPO21_06225 [Bacteroidales bacterium]|nr:hypothetical protein [Bacteroidales bacterium]